jgi:outer membrane lipoprotein-sorting protein
MQTSRWWIVVIALTLSATTAHAGGDGFDRIEAAYGDGSSLSASFRDATYQGRIYLKRDGDRKMMRWDNVDVDGAPTFSTISDGETLWIVDHTISTILVSRDLTTHPPPATRPFFEAHRLGKVWTARVDRSGTIRLTPRKKDPRYRKLFVVVGDAGVEKITVFAPDGANHVFFDDVDLATELDDALFVVHAEDFPGYAVKD